jgi:nitrate reductase gamma subunit
MLSILLASVSATWMALTANPDVVAEATQNPPVLTGWALVLNRLEFVVTVPLIYVSLLFCLVMLGLRMAAIFRAPAQPYPLKIFPASGKPGLAMLKDTFAMPQIRQHQPLFWVFLMIFHLSFLLLILGHLDILPRISLLSEESRHMLGAGLVGVGVTLPLFYFLLRRFRTPVREITVPADYLLLLLIIFLCLFGDLMSWGNSWTANGFIMTKQDFAEYFRSLARFEFVDPRQILPGSHYHFLVIHVLLADLFFLVLPFSKVVHAFLAMPVNLLRRK